MWRNLRSDRGGRPPRSPRHRDESGVVLLLVMLVLALISVLVLTWAQEWRTELQLASNYREAHQCRRLAEAGVYYALGKLLENKILESSIVAADPQAAAKLTGGWLADQRVHELKLPGGLVAVRVEDEGGKVNLNLAGEETLTALFTFLGFSPERIPIMVDSILDWRSAGEQPRPFGAKSAYYKRLDPPYICRDGPFETVTELSWVRGFEVATLAPRLVDYLTVQKGSRGININTAPLAVLEAVGLPPEVAQGIVAARQLEPFKGQEQISQLAVNPITRQAQQLTVMTSPFFTIKSTGMINKNGGRHTIKVIARIEVSRRNPWQILSWVDDFPG
jgi:general secretion pathway protein K